MSTADTGGSAGPRLHQLLGVAEDVPVDRLRSSYERAMNEALRRGDNRRALELSRAFDNLPTRSRVYSSAGEPSLAAQRAQLYSPDEPRRARRSRVALRESPSFGRPRRRITRRGVVSTLLIALVVVGVVALIVRYNKGPEVPGDRFQVPPQPQYSAPQVPDAQTASPTPSLPARRVPSNAPVDRNGFVRVSCPDTRDGAAYVQLARPGSVVTCRNGAVPLVSGASGDR